ncbi:MAG: M42 family metallopeptidase [Elusimicrobiaceae bacterium]|nr:M42 family metallopeptidase [Elusimicrobiaceae bacterium]
MSTKLNFSLLSTLTGLAGVSGREAPVREFLRKRLSSCADEIKTDALGNLIVYKRGTSDKNLVLCAHMDEVGLMVRYMDERGFIYFVPVGGIDPRTLLAQWVRIQTKTGPILGVIGTKPAHVTTEAERGKAVPMNDLYIDTGLSAQELRAQVTPGDSVVLDRTYEEFGTNRICAKALDNRAGVFVLAELLRAVKTPFYNIYAVFTVQEEVGLRGAKTAAFGIKADLGFALDTTGAADIPGCAAQDQLVRLGDGVGISVIDGYTITPQWLFEGLKQFCTKENIRWQVRVAPRGGNDAGAIHLDKTGVAACALSIPTRNIHSCVEVIDKQDVQAMFRLMLGIAQQGLEDVRP